MEVNGIRNKDGEEFYIVKSNGEELDIKFRGYPHIITRRKSEVYNGSIKNPFKRRVYGVGYFGFKESRIKDRHPDFSCIYSIWKDMLRRCYKDDTIYKKENVVVCDEWFNFKTFYQWVLSKDSNYKKKDYF